MTERLIAIYHIMPEGMQSAESVAQSLALGQSVETWTPIPGQSPELLEQHRGEVESITEVSPGRYEVRCSFPAVNFEDDVPTVLTTLMGKPSFGGRIRLMDVLPGEGFLMEQPGPKLGVEGVRKRIGAATDRPLAMSIFKPCVGLPPATLARMFEAQCRGGVDLVKDDEITPDIVSARTTDRIAAMGEVSERLLRETGRRTLYVVNLTGPNRELADRAAMLVASGAQALLLNVLVYGFGALADLARDPRINVPLMAHPSLAGTMCSNATRGFSYGVILGRFMRWAGADIVLFPAQYGSHAIPAQEAEAIRDRLLEPAGRLHRALPGPSAGVHPGMTERILRDYGHDVVINAGGGVQGHPGGGEAGARALRESIEWVTSGHSLHDPLPEEFSALRQALETWGVVD